ncbi:branched-chain amino acid transport system substrate-binding protein [Rhizobium azooxidifex]|uniref:Branched-chain amino acid transport system substrate-binding protein n=1 Tax=Mycoplana azooxidifex TaxID=1636188 RepID=A0A7W6GM59_9HYPH|nr:transporter substrate-binding protein [Mycoplana azooxidifex]MBB3979923.1 branched-chain amino acid transport system substrate-binding protein [Mycoplana azooxidifex]
MKRTVGIGVLLSRSGMYAALSRASRDGVFRGVEEVNADPSLDVSFRVNERDPEGRLDRYAPLCREILRDSGARHIFGCITSASRKEVIPELERFDGILWYPVPYEGFEASERVAYMHACPNQHLLPLLDWALPTLGTRAYLVGSNYIWGWEMAQIAREKIAVAEGQILGDRYLPMGDTELDHIIHDIRTLKPSFILNSLVGDSSYAFLARLTELKRETEFADDVAVLSCNFTECEIDAAGEAAEGLVSAGPWFEPDGGSGGSFHEMARQSVHELAQLLHGRPGAEELPLAELLHTALRSGRATRLDPVHLHARQPAIIARLESGRFNEIKRLPVTRADPYLTQRSQPVHTGSRLKVVS